MIKNKQSLEDAKSKVIAKIGIEEASIGEYNEKKIHSVLKNYFENDVNKQEVKVGNYIADIQNEYGIIEIQTSNFNKLRPKLDEFLPNYDVTIVYPIIVNKKIIWLNSINEKDYMRISPKHKNIFSAFRELYKIKYYLNNKNLHFYFVYLESIELKNLDGWGKDNKKNATIYDKIPISIIKEEGYHQYEDFIHILDEVNEEFTVKSLTKKFKASKKDIAITLTVLSYLGIIEHIRNNGKEYVYRKN